MDAISRDDNKWISDDYMELTFNWFKAHFALEPNKTRLLMLDLPIYIFHGTHDANAPIEGVYDIQERFRVLGKTNLYCHIFEDHNHDLNFEKWLTEKVWAEGLQRIFDTSAELSENVR